MATAKDKLAQTIQRLPDDSTYEQILRQLALAVIIERGLEDSGAGRTISNDEMKRRIESWQR